MWIELIIWAELLLQRKKNGGILITDIKAYQ